MRPARCLTAGSIEQKKGPVVAWSSHRGRPTRHGDDKPGLPAQGEERGAIVSLNGLDGDGRDKFQCFFAISIAADLPFPMPENSRNFAPHNGICLRS